MNKLKLSGTISSDPIIDITNGINPVVNLILLDEYNGKENFFNITAFGERAATLKNAKRGDFVYIEGHIQQEKWFSKKINKKLSRIIVVVDRVSDAIPW